MAHASVAARAVLKRCDEKLTDVRLEKEKGCRKEKRAVMGRGPLTSVYRVCCLLADIHYGTLLRAVLCVNTS